MGEQTFRETEKKYQDLVDIISRGNLSEYYLDLKEDSYYSFKTSDFLQSVVPKEGKWSWLKSLYINQFVDNDFKEEVASKLEDAYMMSSLSEGTNLEIDFRLTTLGVSKWIRYLFTLAERGADGNPERVILIVRDVTDIVSAEAQEKERLLKSNEELRKAYESAELTSNAKTDLLAQLSHDIRTPMNTIIGLSAVADTNIDDERKVTECLGMITDSAQHLLDMINEVLDISEVEAGALRMSEGAFSLQGMIEEIIDSIMPAVKKHNHTLVVKEIDIKHTDVIGDRMRVRQAILSMLENAIQYTPDRGEISVSLVEGKLNNVKLADYMIVVSDNGIGISESNLEKLFNPYERIEDDRVRQKQGIGLGMPILKHIVQMLGGSIEVESKVDEGTTFTVHIQLKLQEQPTNTEVDTSALAKKLEGSMNSDTDSLEIRSYEGKRVLVVEDNEINREVTAEILRMSKLEVELAEDGEQAVDMILSNDNDYYDMVFMDIQMPNMNGYEATEAVRSIEKGSNRHLPIIAMTANAHSEDIFAAEKAGMDEHLAKPLDMVKLQKVLAIWLNK